MYLIDQIYINGQFVTPHGAEMFDLVNPTTGQLAGQVRLGDAEDTRRAIAAARAAFPAFARTGKAERGAMLQRLHDAVLARADEAAAALVEEYGGPLNTSMARSRYTANMFLDVKKVMDDHAFEKTVNTARVKLEPVGVVGIITPWNSSAWFVANKVATAIAAGCTVVVKPSELSARQNQILTEAFHAAALPSGVVNIVNGRGDVVGAELSTHPDITKISFTGSTPVGKQIARLGVDTMKRVTLELGGKSANVILDDADFARAIPTAVAACYMNNGQACIAGTRLLVPAHRLDEVKALAKTAAEAVVVGDPQQAAVSLGPVVTHKQYERVQRYIAIGIEEGAELVTGGLGKPQGLEAGYFIKPTVFAGVTPAMTIAREEIFGPVLSIMSYETEEEAIAIANDTPYGLQAYVSSTDLARASRVADQLVAGRVHINGIHDDLIAPFGGFKQSGIGREFGPYGLEAYLEPKAILGEAAQYR
ncbi:MULTISPECIES: aldehyde dehydrogenase family protein [unclassified Duganella]|uniref:aldehyde dehydrogenase family protein n=1 Tax=unclassified Duganella TaxID=2636909 RepID=UPI00088CDCA4|nr:MULTISPECIES: aldehyde dehydrogenase family protein [unclassified Duganella]SDH24508.1 aldehyde dehydrogenase (NAD+) [Duganella sp. OV458]SDK43792.1 aldehyde dehydrogenase (NAD+) [Duganella sp. OV510]